MRIVVKVGTSTLTHRNGRLNIRRVSGLCRILSDIKNSGEELVVVSSGAIGMGVGKMSLSERPEDMPSKQAMAAIGQCELMYVYDKLFSEYNHVVAQILLTAEDFKDPHRHRNFSNTILRLLDFHSIPIINENDTIATEEVSLGDNDTLAARVAVSIKAELLIILSDIEGLYTSDPHIDPNAELIRELKEISPEIRGSAGKQGTHLGTGGMITKLDAAKICMDSGIDMIIANGTRPSLLYDIMEGKPVGTKFLSSGRRKSNE